MQPLLYRVPWTLSEEFLKICKTRGILYQLCCTCTVAAHTCTRTFVGYSHLLKPPVPWSTVWGQIVKQVSLYKLEENKCWRNIHNISYGHTSGDYLFQITHFSTKRYCGWQGMCSTLLIANGKSSAEILVNLCSLPISWIILYVVLSFIPHCPQLYGWSKPKIKLEVLTLHWYRNTKIYAMML